ncbi:jg19867 [Pararge aegeria aegeria]|uniref:Innexin n=1 Tax=Pararge aegeria aegeria TaxID=348720 RepID=A0A8S4RBT1_9NEOP|nr:jg19867 [Pararge aegeria aegeria]
MLDVFRGLKNLIKVNYVHIDSPVFRLHYSITVILLIAFSLIVTTRQYVGNPIDCIHTKDIPEDVLNTYCWIHSTYTLKSFFTKKVGVEVPYPGIGNSREKGKEDMSDRKIYKYYQWVCFCLFFQSFTLDRVVVVDDDTFPLATAAPAMRLHLLRSSAFLEHWTMEICIAAFITSVQRVGDRPRDRLPYIFPWTTSRSMECLLLVMCPKNLRIRICTVDDNLSLNKGLRSR